MPEGRAEEYRERRVDVPPYQVRIISYRLGTLWHAKADDVDPGANIARSDGATREEAEEAVLSAARRRILATRRSD